ncbi:MAG: hypothetical protein ABR583_13335 [Gaiellaceae bacterium]
MSERTERIVKNEALHRDVNERVRQVEDRMSARGLLEPRTLDEYFCECGLGDCMEKIRLTREEYEEVRSSPIRFAIMPEHLIADVERVLTQNERFAMIEKVAGEREIATARHPRT